MNTPGYEKLAAVLQAAYDQAATGKGAERHADSKPFHEQPMQTSSDLLGTDAGLAFQAIKKVREGSTFAEFERFEREMLGAINYIAGMVIWRRRQRDANLAAAALDAAYKHPTCPGCGLYREHTPDCPAITAKLAQPYVAPDPCAECGYVGVFGDAAGTHYATCSKLTAPKEFVDQVEQTFDELESSVSGQCPECGAALGTRHKLGCAEYAPLGEPTAEPAADQRMNNIARNGNTGEHYDDPWFGAPEWARWKAQDMNGQWYWFEQLPRHDDTQWVESSLDGRVLFVDRCEPNWRDTLIQRP